MSDFISIKEAKQLGKGNIRFRVVSLGELENGTTKAGDEWQKQVAVIKDDSTAMDLTLWAEDIGEIIVGKTYSLENGYWTVYKEEPQLSLGKFYKLNEISKLSTNTLDDATEDAMNSKTTYYPKTNSHDELDKVTQNDMLARIYDMTKEMYYDFIDKKLKESK